MVSAGRHPKNAINAALARLSDGFEVEEVHKGHRWGLVRCTVCGETAPVWSTPRVPEHNARLIERFVDRHQHATEEE